MQVKVRLAEEGRSMKAVLLFAIRIQLVQQASPNLLHLLHCTKGKTFLFSLSSSTNRAFSGSANGSSGKSMRA